MELLKILCVCLIVCSATCSASLLDIFNWFSPARSTRDVAVNVDKYCQSVFGGGSYLCRENYKTGYDYLCGSLYCYDKTSKKCAFAIAPGDSTLCGNGKWCVGQACQQDAGALTTSDTCPLGDTSNQDVAFGKNCSEIADKFPQLCQNATINSTWCCDSCSNVHSNTTANFSGPAITAYKSCQAAFGSDSYFCMNDVHYQGIYGDNMCHNLYCHNSNTGQCEAVPADDGVPCGDGKWCVNGKCIQSSDAPVDPKSECYYGSQYQTFCAQNIKYPKIASYCLNPTYESGCCSFCLPHKNSSWIAPFEENNQKLVRNEGINSMLCIETEPIKIKTGCEYGDTTAAVCQAQVQAGTIKAYCLTHENECCQTCAELKNGTDPNCPYGDSDAHKCKVMIEDSIGTGNCYNQQKRQECCETCAEYFNASRTGCEYGDHWADYCDQNVKPPKVADQCARYESQCCATCNKFKENGFAGCRYGDRDPAVCAALMNSTRGTANCYDYSTQSLCCATCHQIKDETTPSCLYGDIHPNTCKSLMNDSLGVGNCYDLKGKINCCRTCAEHRNSSNTGCEYGDHLQEWCSKNIYSNETSWLCFNSEGSCCESCAQYKLSDFSDCKYGDKDPANCRFMIPDEQTAAARCPSLINRCCFTCSMYGHPGITGGIQMASVG